MGPRCPVIYPHGSSVGLSDAHHPTIIAQGIGAKAEELQNIVRSLHGCDSQAVEPDSCSTPCFRYAFTNSRAGVLIDKCVYIYAFQAPNINLPCVYENVCVGQLWAIADRHRLAVGNI